MKKKSLDFYLGLFVLAGLAAIAFMILKFGGMSTRNIYEVIVLFDDVGGLNEEAPVNYAGVQCGMVSRMIGYGEPVEDMPHIPLDKVKVILALNDTTTLRRGDKVKIVAVSLLGDMAVQIEPGPRTEPEWPKTGNAVLGGSGTVALPEPILNLAESAQKVVDNLEKLTGEEGPLTKTAAGLSDLVGQTVPDFVNDIGGAVKTVTAEVESLLKDNRRQIGSLIVHLDETVTSSSDFIENLERLTREDGSITKTVDELRTAVGDVRRVIRNIAPILANIRDAKGGLGKFITDPTWYEKFDNLLTFMGEHGIPMNLHPEKDLARKKKGEEESSGGPVVWVR
ncbi:MCE family protein [bacterium]|nr:MCE family protein [bacterium]